MLKPILISFLIALSLTGCGLVGNSPAASRGFDPEGNRARSDAFTASPIGTPAAKERKSAAVEPAAGPLSDPNAAAIPTEVGQSDVQTPKRLENPVYVAVVETISDGVIQANENQFLTDVLREEAVKVLDPSLNYTIMTRENIQAMLPPDKNIEDCEGSCLVETGRNIAANYVVQARVNTFGTSLTITVELYDTRTGKLMSSFSAKKTDIDSLEVEIREKAPQMFQQVLKLESN
ncbi:MULTISPECIES: hypothetical protein [unclassified Fibrobacter]|uniref:hypothetical protein n=1 Tax=unclassified Fibrobacter TaxID=2634177 RepID=UPI000D6B81A1|nr:MULTISPECIES: hypothetical protein [unclassified Fibrobacter]PWJ61874.1 hypothetical protein BGX12_1241 [Fibrobacter sp. UWR4]PZW67412.1 hypothetical protein C8E88_10241 [Fibrobacter sp. UWR1]